jgi:GcrA cell cycle regulator
MSSTWTDAKVKMLAALAGDGWSSSQIAKKLGFTRNAIIGKVHRLGLKLKNLVNGTVPHPPRKHRKKVVSESWALQSQPYNEPVVVAPPESEQPGPMTLLKLTNGMCKWPINDGYPQFYFCGKPCALGPYCPEHTRKAYSQVKHR